MICSQKLEIFENKKVDETGKIIYEPVPNVVGLYLGYQEGTVYFMPLDNINDILLKFKELKESAMKE